MPINYCARRLSHRSLTSLCRPLRIVVSRRHLHASSACHALPVPSSVEAAASKWVQSRINPNHSPHLSNLPLSIALLQAAHERERSSTTAAHSTNIVINPVSVALQLQASQNSQRALLDALPHRLSAEQLRSALSGVDHSRIASELTAANSPFAEWSFTQRDTAASEVQSTERRPTSSFTGFLAPRFALTKTVSPSWFIPTPTATQHSAFSSNTTLPYRADESAVTALERSIRVPARMLYRTGKLWYVEGPIHQMVDVPYLHPHYSLTLLCARWTSEPSIDDHPQLAYGNLRRDKSDIHSLIHSLSAQQLVHDMTYMTLLPGLLVMPAFDAQYNFRLAGTGSGSGIGSSEVSAVSDVSRVVVSGAGLQSGGLKTLSHRPGRPFPHFLMSAHRPFVFVIRHRPTNHVALIGLVEQVQRDPTEYKYKTRKVQWLEDTLPIQQF